eukprot:gb/GFBE01009598.1/.p1 GENE.gb/GFBE01009598.1/~~gb/GFBE01009598.1/.p1  ORF type:complete len:253 (+),score=51.28 gb/GFBE01009598.1/:1-759(+)
MQDLEKEETDPLLRDAQNHDVKRASVAVRRGFVRKVYGLLTAQLALTVLIAAQIVLAASASSAEDWIKSHEWLLWLSVFGTIAMMCSLLCCRDVVRSYPTNYIILFAFTAAEAIMIGFVSTMFTPQSLLLAAGVTTLIFLALTGYATFSSTDFTGSAPYIFAGLTGLLIFGLVLMLLPLFGVPVAVATMVYDFLGVVLFSFCIIFDTQLMLGEWGGHKVTISIDEYVFAALNLYMDIVNLFFHLLSLVGERR